MKTINLALKKLYFLQILHGEKTEEFRLYNDYYIDRLMNKNDLGEIVGFKEIEAVRFHLGRWENAPDMVVEVKKIYIVTNVPPEKRNEGNSDFVIVLGNILESKNCEEFLKEK